MEDPRSEEMRHLRGEIRSWKRRFEKRENELGLLKSREEELMEECGRRGHRIRELEHYLRQFQKYEQGRTQHISEIEERLKLTEELLETRSAELTGAQAFLSTNDCLSEAEMFSIVRDLNETVYQIAVELTEKWENLEPLRTTNPTEVDPVFQPYALLVRLIRKRIPMGLTFLLQSYLCFQVVSMTSSWDHHQELSVLRSIHQRLSASGEHHFRRQVMCDPHIS